MFSLPITTLTPESSFSLPTTSRSTLLSSTASTSADTLLENDGERSGDYDWEIVSIQAAPVAGEPMKPVTMARNFLARPGGTPCEYSARDFALAIEYWSRRCDLLEDDD